MTDRNRDSMKDVSHTPPNGDSVTNVWERGAGAAEDEPAEPADD